MKALSVRQPWATLIISGQKTIENRRWTTPYRGPLLIHASQQVDTGSLVIYAEKLPSVDLDGKGSQPLIPTRGIIGMVMLVDVVTESDDPWFEGPYGWVLADPTPLPFVEMRGALGLFEVPVSAYREVQPHE
jgi:hypothetical protein